MQKEIIIVIIIVILIITAHVVTQNYTKKSIALINEEISNVQEIGKQLEESEQTNQEKENELLGKMKDVRDGWQQINKNMSFYIEHDELEKVNTSLILAEKYLEMEEYKEGVPELKNSTDSILSISIECGFANISHFNRSFKKKYGITPSQYRTQNSKQSN